MRKNVLKCTAGICCLTLMLTGCIPQITRDHIIRKLKRKDVIKKEWVMEDTSETGDYGSTVPNLRCDYNYYYSTANGTDEYVRVRICDSDFVDRDIFGNENTFLGNFLETSAYTVVVAEHLEKSEKEVSYKESGSNKQVTEMRKYYDETEETAEKRYEIIVVKSWGISTCILKEVTE